MFVETNKQNSMRRMTQKRANSRDLETLKRWIIDTTMDSGITRKQLQDVDGVRAANILVKEGKMVKSLEGKKITYFKK